MTQSLTERYRDRLAGVLSCYDRIVITGTLPGACYAQGMTSFRYSRGIRIFDYARLRQGQQTDSFFCQWKGIVTGSRPLTSVEIDAG